MHDESLETGGTPRRPLWTLEIRSTPEQPATMAAYRRIATAAESVGVDILIAAGTTSDGGFLEPVPVLTALSVVTDRIGLVADVCTNFTYPYNTARRLSTLDRMSDGRGGWRPRVDGPPAAAYGLTEVTLDVRLARRDEFLEVVSSLWRSWGPDALLLDRARGLADDPEAIQAINHVGRFFQVSGPADQPRPPQGRPLLVNDEDPMTWSAEVTRLVDILITEPDVVDAWGAAATARLAAEGRPRSEIRVIVRDNLSHDQTHHLEPLGATADGICLVADLGMPDIDDVLNRWAQALDTAGVSRPTLSGATLRERLGLPIPTETHGQRPSRSTSTTRTGALA